MSDLILGYDFFSITLELAGYRPVKPAVSVSVMCKSLVSDQGFSEKSPNTTKNTKNAAGCKETSMDALDAKGNKKARKTGLFLGVSGPYWTV